MKPAESARARLTSLASLLSLVVGFLFVWNSLPTQQLSATSSLAAPEVIPELETTPIEALRVGQRVPGRNPDRAQVDLFIPDVDPLSWSQIDLVMDKENGDQLNISLLRPSWWLEWSGAAKGSQIWLELPELDAVGYADVLAVLPCPAIETGQGNVITGTFRHSSSANLLNVTVEDSDEEIGVTINHPF